MFSPNVISTPMPGQYRQQQPYSPMSNVAPSMPNPALDASVTSPYPFSPKQSPTFEISSPFVLSAKHNGLYLYLGRILRPIWNKCCVQKMAVDPVKIYVSKRQTGENNDSDIYKNTITECTRFSSH